MTWQRLSVRRGNTPPDVLVEGVPAYLKHPLDEWVRTEAGWHRTSSQGGVDQQFLRTLAMTLRIPVQASYKTGGISDQVMAALGRDEDLYLDALDAILHIRRRSANAEGLRSILELGASAWTVAPDGSALQRRVEDSAIEAFIDTVLVSNPVSDELNEAWAAAFGRDPNPSDAWDHAIKALEELLVPIVIPGVVKPNLGGVAGELASASHKWSLTTSTSSSTIDDGKTVEAMLRVIWPNPDWHGGGRNHRVPSSDEAARVVHLAVAIVQLCRDGGLTKAA